MAKADVDIFAANIRYLMARLELTDLDLATMLGIDRYRVKAWRSGKCFPREDALVKLCEFFQYYDIFKLITEKIKIHDTKNP
jgi:transcriptional regulator with XRE-family HTH domain